MLLGKKPLSLANCQNSLISCKIDICLLSKTKIDETFPNTQFEIEGYKTFHSDRSKHEGGIMFYMKDNIACR